MNKQPGPRVPRIWPKPDDKPEVVQLARLLVRAAVLAELVNSDEFTNQDRVRLVVLTGRVSYLSLTWNLDQLIRTWSQAGHPGTWERRRKKPQRWPR